MSFQYHSDRQYCAGMPSHNMSPTYARDRVYPELLTRGSVQYIAPTHARDRINPEFFTHGSFDTIPPIHVRDRPYPELLTHGPILNIPTTHVRDRPYLELLTHGPIHNIPPNVRDRPHPELLTHGPIHNIPPTHVRDRPHPELFTHGPVHNIPPTHVRQRPYQELFTHRPHAQPTFTVGNRGQLGHLDHIPSSHFEEQRFIEPYRAHVLTPHTHYRDERLPGSNDHIYPSVPAQVSGRYSKPDITYQASPTCPPLDIQGYSQLNKVENAMQGYSQPMQNKTTTQVYRNETDTATPGYSSPNNIETATHGYSQSNQIETATQGYSQPIQNKTEPQGYIQPKEIETVTHGYSQSNRIATATQGYSQSMQNKTVAQDYCHPNEIKTVASGYSQSNQMTHEVKHPTSKEAKTVKHNLELAEILHSTQIALAKLYLTQSKNEQSSIESESESQIEINEQVLEPDSCDSLLNDCQNEIKSQNTETESNDALLSSCENELKSEITDTKSVQIMNNIEIEQCNQILQHEIKSENLKSNHNSENVLHACPASEINSTIKDIASIQSQLLAAIPDPENVYSPEQIVSAQSCNLISQEPGFSGNDSVTDKFCCDKSNSETLVESVKCDMTYSDSPLYLDRLFSEHAESSIPVKEIGLISRPEFQSRAILKGHAIISRAQPLNRYIISRRRYA